VPHHTFLSLSDPDSSDDNDEMARTKMMVKATGHGRGTRMTKNNRPPQPPDNPNDPSNPEDNTLDNNTSLMGSKSNNSGGGGSGGGDGDGGYGDDNDPNYNFNEGQWSEMVDLFVSQGFSLATERHMLRDKQIDQVEVFSKLMNAHCMNIVKNPQQVPIPGPGSQTKFLTVSNAALNKFQMVVFAAKHGKQTSRSCLI
jgi:hypothetical protein